MSTVISIENVSKTYRLGDIGGGTLKEGFARWCAKLRGKPDALAQIADLFLALDNVSFEVKQGEVLGVIGRNGAGKSTLLKILSQVTAPSSGRIRIRGRIASMLEVGTGFHPELTGRENIFLNGAILGMTKAEIRKKFDSIVAFSEIEQFIDTPVKRFSSGMYVRLAFAVAAHLEPDILIVDEVLAVGDISFQKKCLGKMGDVAKQGRTVVLVSHQLNPIRRLCDRAVWLDKGVVRQLGPPHEVASAYESATRSRDETLSVRDGVAKERAKFICWDIEGADASAPHRVDSLDPLTIRFHLAVRTPIPRGVHGIALYNHQRHLIWGTAAYNFALAPGDYYFSYKFPTLPLRPGPYSWLVSLFDDQERLDLWEATPEMIVATESYQHPRDEGSGLLNLKVGFSADAVITEGVGVGPYIHKDG
jgi:lipopolysaccharide transport system ATP-binding protein